MFKHLLVATDGSPLSERAALKSVQLAKSMSARLTAVTVSVPVVSAADAVIVTDTDVDNEERARRAEANLAVVRAAAESSGVSFEGVHAFDDNPYAAIIDAANARDCDVICMASHGRRGFTALVLGSETVKVLTHSRIPVLVWR